MERTPRGSGEQREEEGAAEQSCYGLITAHIPLYCLDGKERVKMSLGRWERQGEGGFSIVFVFYHPTLFFISNNLIFPMSSLFFP